MQCDSCKREAVLCQRYSGRHLCHVHLSMDLEAKAKRFIREHRSLRSGDYIGILFTGDKPDGALVHFMNKLIADRRDVRLALIPAPGNLPWGTLCESGRKVSARYGIPLLPSKEWSFYLNGRKTGGEVASLQFRHKEQNFADEQITKVAVSIPLEDAASWILSAFLQGNPGSLAGSGSERVRIPVLCPFFPVSAGELETYWDGLGSGICLSQRHVEHDEFTGRVSVRLKEFNSRHPATNHALLSLGEHLAAGLGGLTPGMLKSKLISGRDTGTDWFSGNRRERGT